RADGRRFLVEPEDSRYPFTIALPNQPLRKTNLNDGDAVIVKLNSNDAGDQRFISGEIIEVLGNPERLDVQL
ncbi:MAG: hypothetical protein P8X39_06965, partial [Desulfofustis sp.]